MIKKMTLLTALLACSAFTAAQTTEQPNITVYGTAEIKVTPDEMVWSINVKTENRELPAAAAAHDTAVGKVLEFLKGLNINEDKLQTSRMHFGENWKYVERENVKVGYYASTDIGFTISDLNLYQKLWFALSGFEGVSIQSIQYDHSARIRLQNESRQKALLAAREKAESLAKTLGSQIGEPLRIEEIASPLYPQPLYANRAMQADMAQGGAEPSLALGQISISTKVLTVFRLRNP
jgi:hypothetical protein